MIIWNVAYNISDLPTISNFYKLKGPTFGLAYFRGLVLPNSTE